MSTVPVATTMSGHGSCSNEAHAHDHGHEHGHGHEGHDHDHDLPTSAGPHDSLYGEIDRDNVVALNAMGGGETGKNVIKTWDDREDDTIFCESDVDDSLIIKIPFTSSVKLRSITLKAGPGGKTPAKMLVFLNTPGLDFSDAESSKPTQEFDIVPNREGVEYAVRASKFANVRTIQLFFPNNTDNAEGGDGEEETTRVAYVGLRGSWTKLPKEPGVILYEAQARPTDHKVTGLGAEMGGSLGQGF